MEVEKKDFVGMFFRIHGNAHLERCKNVPRLKTFKHVKESEIPKKHQDQTKRWVVYMYDKELGRFWREQNMTLKSRRGLAARLAGFDEEKDSDFLNTIFENNNVKALEMINDVLRVQNNRLWSEISVNLHLFYEYQEQLLDPAQTDSGDKDLMQILQLKSKLREELSLVRSHLESLELEFYGNDEELKSAVTERIVDPLKIAALNV